MNSRSSAQRAPNFLIRTFGCKTNQYETQAMREQLLAAGAREVDDPRAADLLLVNTCSVTARADASCRRALRALKRENPHARLAVIGCAVDLAQAWVASLPGVDLRIPNADKHRLASLLLGEPSPAPPPDPRLALTIRDFRDHTRAFLKIQDGCAGSCSYCTVPRARGRPASRPLPEILEEARILADRGFREIVLTGINIGAYAWGDRTRLAEVVAALSAHAAPARLRLGSVEPNLVSDDLLAALAASARACPHLHLPLQSGCDAILAAMRRPYTCEQFAATVARVRAALDRPGLTTDVIVGFPGEGEAEFTETLAFCERIGFSGMHIFPYSPRPGTPAAALRRTQSNRTVSARHARLRAAAEEAAAQFAASFVGEEAEALLEAAEGGTLTGYTERYLRARVAADSARLRTVVRRRAQAHKRSELILG